MKRSVAFGVLSALLVAVATTGLGTKRSEAAEQITVAAGIAITWAPLYIAEEQNFFAKHNLSAKVIPFPSGRAAQEAIVGGSVNWGTVAETPVMFASLNRIPVRIIGTMAVYEVFDVAVSSGIEKIEDLKGKRIGYAQGTNSQVYLSRMLDKAKLSSADVTAINLSPPDMVTSLTNKQIDAFIWTEPHLSQAIDLGKGSVKIIRLPGLYSTYSSIVALKKTIDENPSILVNSLRALIDGTEYIKKEQSKSVSAVAARIRMDAKIAEKDWQRIPFEIRMDKDRIVADLRSQAEWAIKSGLVASGTVIPDFNEVVVTDIYEKAKK